jgi:hypothetical protein
MGDENPTWEMRNEYMILVEKSEWIRLWRQSYRRRSEKNTEFLQYSVRNRNI